MNVVVANRDFTERWSCREEDLVAWLRAPGILQSATDFRLADFWYLRDGEHVIASNRSVDFPDWFTLHPTEASGVEAARMMTRLNEGWEPVDAVEGPNVWRVRAGDRVVWIRSSSGTTGHTDGVLTILDCHNSVLVAGEGRRNTIDEWTTFGDLRSEQPTAAQQRQLQAGLAAAKAFGAPRNFSSDWLIG